MAMKSVRPFNITILLGAEHYSRPPVGNNCSSSSMVLRASSISKPYFWFKSSNSARVAFKSTNEASGGLRQSGIIILNSANTFSCCLIIWISSFLLHISTSSFSLDFFLIRMQLLNDACASTCLYLQIPKSCHSVLQNQI